MLSGIPGISVIQTHGVRLDIRLADAADSSGTTVCGGPRTHRKKGGDQFEPPLFALGEAIRTRKLEGRDVGII